MITGVVNAYLRASVAQSFACSGTTATLELGSAVVSAAPLTVAMWFKPDGTQTSFALAAVGGTTARLALIDNSGGAGVDHIDAFSTNNAGTTNSGTGPTNWTASTWAHAGAVFASTTSRTAYFNGIAGTTNTGSSSPSGFSKTNFSGRYNASARGLGFAGIMVHMAMWDIALNGTEMATLATPGTVPTDVQPGHIICRPIWSGASVIDAVSGSAMTVVGVTGSSDLPF